MISFLAIRSYCSSPAWLRGLQSDSGFFQTAALCRVGGKSGYVHSGWGWYCRATDDRQPQEAFLEQGGTVGSSALLQAVLRKIFPVPAGGKDIIN